MSSGRMPGRQIAWRLIFETFIGLALRPLRITVGAPVSPVSYQNAALASGR